MILTVIRYGAAGVLIVLGIVVMAVSTFGVFRIGYALNRMHASAMGDSLGMLFVSAGLAVLYGFSLATCKLLFILILFWCASPVCSHLLADLEAYTNDNLTSRCEIAELSELEGGENK